MTQKDKRALPELGDPHANRADIENSQPLFAHMRLLSHLVNDATGSGRVAAAGIPPSPA